MSAPVISQEWPVKTIARLRGLWDEGLSTSKIAKQLGRSKNSVVGKAHRLNLPSRPSPIIRDGIPHPRVIRVHRATITLEQFRSCEWCGKPLEQQLRFCSVACKALSQIREIVRKPRVAAPAPRAREPKPAASTHSVFKTCQWLEGDPRARNFCDDPTKPGSSWCESHHRRCYVSARSMVDA